MDTVSKWVPAWAAQISLLRDQHRLSALLGSKFPFLISNCGSYTTPACVGIMDRAEALINKGWESAGWI